MTAARGFDAREARLHDRLTQFHLTIATNATESQIQEWRKHRDRLSHKIGQYVSQVLGEVALELSRFIMCPGIHVIWEWREGRSSPAARCAACTSLVEAPGVRYVPRDEFHAIRQDSFTNSTTAVYGNFSITETGPDVRFSGVRFTARHPLESSFRSRFWVLADEKAARREDWKWLKANLRALQDWFLAIRSVIRSAVAAARTIEQLNRRRNRLELEVLMDRLEMSSDIESVRDLRAIASLCDRIRAIEDNRAEWLRVMDRLSQFLLQRITLAGSRSEARRWIQDRSRELDRIHRAIANFVAKDPPLNETEGSPAYAPLLETARDIRETNRALGLVLSLERTGADHAC